MEEPILQVKHLQTHFYSDGNILRAVDDLTYDVHEGECVAIIGESGSGKTVSALSLLRLVQFPPGLIVGGEVLFRGENLLDYNDEQMRAIRGKQISMIFQEPSVALNPVMTIGDQIVENILNHTGGTRAEAKERAALLLGKIGIPNPDMRLQDYPHQFSGGMQQRAMIAMAMSCNPEILIADEPTTALDVTVQAQVLEQLNEMRRELGTALIIITHNLGIVARYADSVKIMYGGKLVEDGPTDEVFRSPSHPYTMGLIRAVPRLDKPLAHGLHTIDGEPPDLATLDPESCAFRERCPCATEACAKSRPETERVGEDHYAACFNRDQVQEVMGGVAK